MLEYCARDRATFGVADIPVLSSLVVVGDQRLLYKSITGRVYHKTAPTAGWSLLDIPPVTALHAFDAEVYAVTEEGDLYFTNPWRSALSSSVRTIVSGSNHGFAITQDGCVYGRGINEYGQLGVGDFQTCSGWVAIPLPAPVQQMSAARSYTLLLTTTGEVYGTGLNREKCLSATRNTYDAFERWQRIALPFVVREVAASNFRPYLCDEQGRWYTCCPKKGWYQLSPAPAIMIKAIPWEERIFFLSSRQQLYEYQAHGSLWNLVCEHKVLEVVEVGNHLTVLTDQHQLLSCWNFFLGWVNITPR